MQPAIHRSDGGPEGEGPDARPRSEPGIADSVNQFLVWLDGLRDRRALSTVVPMLVGSGLALLWVLGQTSEPRSIDSEIPSIAERVQSDQANPDGMSANAADAVPPIDQNGTIATEDDGSSGANMAEDTAIEPGESDQPVVVHVSGAVLHQGLVEVPVGSRLADAITAAGGETEGADVHRLNLATPLVDGMHIRVPQQGSGGNDLDLPLVELPPTGATDPEGSNRGDDRAAPKVNVNQASEVELEALPGIGPAIAAAIVSWREENGPFQTADHLLAVPGIGPAKLSAMEALVVL